MACRTLAFASGLCLSALVCACGVNEAGAVAGGRAVYELRCPREQLEERRVGDTFYLRGCGQQVDYTCIYVREGFGYHYTCIREGEVHPG
jgi:hypothetical protein